METRSFQRVFGSQPGLFCTQMREQSTITAVRPLKQFVIPFTAPEKHCKHANRHCRCQQTEQEVCGYHWFQPSQQKWHFRFLCFRYPLTVKRRRCPVYPTHCMENTLILTCCRLATWVFLHANARTNHNKCRTHFKTVLHSIYGPETALQTRESTLPVYQQREQEVCCNQWLPMPPQQKMHFRFPPKRCI